jgi:hypothetical protein
VKTKTGQAIPQGLAKVLHKGKSMITAWQQLRPSCQKSYVALVEKAKGDPAKRRQALERVAKLTRKFGKRHSEDRQNRGPA